MGGRIIDGTGWVRKRLEFLRERLAEDPPDDERRAIETEIEALSKERGLFPGGPRPPRLFRGRRRPR